MRQNIEGRNKNTENCARKRMRRKTEKVGKKRKGEKGK